MSRTPCSLSCRRFAPAPSNCSTTRANWIDCSRSVPIRPANERRGFSGTCTTEWGLYAEGGRIFQRGSVVVDSAGERAPGAGEGRNGGGRTGAGAGGVVGVWWVVGGGEGGGGGTV